MTNNERIQHLENLCRRFEPQRISDNEREAIGFALDLLKKYAVKEWLKANDRWTNEEYGR